MKTLMLFAIIAFVAADFDYYKLDKLDMDALIRNDEEFKKFVECKLDKGECSKLYSAYKAITVEAFKQACKRCSPYQKFAYWQFLQAMKAKFPSYYVEYRHKYDPENKYFDALESELRKYSIAF